MDREELAATFPHAQFFPELRRPSLGLAFAPQLLLLHRNPLSALLEQTSLTLRTLGSLFHPHSEIGVGNLMGMPGVVLLLHRLSRDDFRGLLAFVMALNVGLAVLNLLPIPPLDGGQIFLATCEKISGRPVPRRLLRRIQSACLLLLLGLLLFVSVGDVVRWRGERRSRAHWEEIHVLPRF
jgi:membrane-associated protease RseP (regulator of RpoE activity)